MERYRQRLEDIEPARAWLAGFGGLVAAILLGVLALPQLVWDRFIWKYFWGPVYADAHDASCTVIEPDTGVRRLLYSPDACANALAGDAIYAQPGYTLVSEFGYMIVLVFMLVGVYLLLERLEVADDVSLYFPLVPFMLFGGALRVVEDAADQALDHEVEPLISYPLNTLFISPIIYVTVFVLTLGSLVVAVRLEEEGRVEDYRTTLGAVGVALLATTLLYLTYVGISTSYATVYPQMLLTVIVLATGISYLVWRAVAEGWPETAATTGYIGFFVIWGQAIDGVSNVVTADWLPALGMGHLAYQAKHPANRIITAATETIQPGVLDEAIGTSWPFLMIKLLVAVLVLFMFTDEFLEDSPRYSLLLLVAVTAVGLGPGTRDLLRVTFGI